MKKYYVYYNLGSETVTQHLEAENVEKLKNDMLLKESGWIVNGKEEHIYIYFNHLTSIKIKEKTNFPNLS